MDCTSKTTDNIRNFLKIEVKGHLSNQKIWWKSVLPFMIPALLCFEMTNRVYNYHPESVVLAASRCFDIGKWLFTIGAVVNLIKNLPETKSLQGRKIEMITISKEEYEKLKTEIECLKLKNA
jgi:hypothetical protein